MIKKIMNSKTIVTIIALAFCFVVIIWAYDSRVSKKINKVPIPVASKRINAREKIELPDKKKKIEGNVKTIKVASSLLSENVIRDINYFSGNAPTNANDNEEKKDYNKYVNYNTFIPANGMFYDSAVVDWDDMPDSAWGDISKDETILSVGITESNAFGNAFYPDDTIDLYIKMRYLPAGEAVPKIVYAKFVEKIKILAVKDENGNHISKRTPSTGKPKHLIFKLSDNNSSERNMFLLLKSAEVLSDTFEIIPIPRNKDYKVLEGEEDGGLISSDFIVQRILEKTAMIPVDNVESDEIVDDSDSSSDAPVDVPAVPAQ